MHARADDHRWFTVGLRGVDGGGIADVARQVLPVQLGAGRPLRREWLALPGKVLGVLLLVAREM